jgi:hypothetical protein
VEGVMIQIMISSLCRQSSGVELKMMDAGNYSSFRGFLSCGCLFAGKVHKPGHKPDAN